MADEKNLHEEEYTYSDIESGDPFVTETREIPKRTVVVDGRKRVLIAVAAIVGVLIAYKLLQLIFTPKIPTTPVVEQPAPVVVAPPVQPSVPVSVTSGLSQLEQQVSNQDTSLKSMQSQVSDLQTTLSQLNTSLTALNARLDTIQKQMADLQKPKQVVVVQKPVRVRPTRVIYRPAPRMPDFYIKAIIPGRAWLRSENGATITVSRGSWLPGYGRITRVAVQQGVVFTSSGRVIRYGPDDI